MKVNGSILTAMTALEAEQPEVVVDIVLRAAARIIQKVLIAGNSVSWREIGEIEVVDLAPKRQYIPITREIKSLGSRKEPRFRVSRLLRKRVRSGQLPE